MCILHVDLLMNEKCMKGCVCIKLKSSQNLIIENNRKLSGPKLVCGRFSGN